MTKEKYYFGDDSDERFYFDMRRCKGYTNKLEKLTCNDGGVTLTVKLKKAATKKMTLRVVAYSHAEYWYTSTNKGYIMTYKDYSIAKDDHIVAWITMKKRKSRKRRKRDRGKPYIRKNKVYFGEGRKSSQRGDSIFEKIL